jgi:hypothetical protein
MMRAQIMSSGYTAGCVVRNISDSGAKIEVGSVGKIPNAISLRVPGHEPQNCVVVWRRLREIGVSFAG